MAPSNGDRVPSVTSSLDAPRLETSLGADLPVRCLLLRSRPARMAGFGVRRDKAALSSGCKAHPAISLQPEAIGAVMEVTKWLKPSNSGHDLVIARVCRPQRE